jgi:DNA polymerase III gamma/tau subunit
MFENFHGNLAVARTLYAMTQQERIPQTILIDGPEGVGKATLAASPLRCWATPAKSSRTT